jgi:O-antigen/teichoic acid export membrane protein
MIFWIIAARLMAPVDIGFATAIISVATMIIYISRVGLDTGLVRYLPTANDKSSMYNTMLIITLLLAIGISIVYILGIDLFSYSLNFLSDTVLAAIFLFYVAFMSINMSQNSAITALRRADLLLIQNSVLGIRILLLFFIAALGLTGILLSFGISYAAAFVVGSIILSRNNIVIFPKVQLSSIREFFKFSFGNYLAGIFAIAPITILPIVIIEQLGADQNAYFYIAYSISSFLFAIPNAVSMSLFIEGSYERPIRDNAIRSIKFIILLLLPSILAIMLFGNSILSLFNSEYAAQSINILKLLAIASLFTIVPTIYLAIKKIQKDLKKITYLSFIQSSIIVVIGYLLLPEYGISGIGYAWIIAGICMNLVIAFLIFKNDRWIGLIRQKKARTAPFSYNLFK